MDTSTEHGHKNKDYAKICTGPFMTFYSKYELERNSDIRKICTITEEIKNNSGKIEGFACVK